MSRGPGRIERRLIVMFSNPKVCGRATDVIRWTAEDMGTAQTPALAVSVRRALARMLARGALVLTPAKLWHAPQPTKTKRKKSNKPKDTDRPGSSNQNTEDFDDLARDFAEHKLAMEKITTRYSRLKKYLGMLGSDHDGEIINAARLAERERKKLGVSWDDIIRPRAEDFL